MFIHCHFYFPLSIFLNVDVIDPALAIDVWIIFYTCWFTVWTFHIIFLFFHLLKMYYRRKSHILQKYFCAICRMSFISHSRKSLETSGFLCCKNTSWQWQKCHAFLVGAWRWAGPPKQKKTMGGGGLDALKWMRRGSVLDAWSVMLEACCLPPWCWPQSLTSLRTDICGQRPAALPDCHQGLS